MEKHDGILLQAIPYLGNRRILKIFTAQAGLLTFMSRLKQTALTSPFCRAEWVIPKSPKGEIFPLKDASLIDPLLDLRKSFAILSAAGKIAQDLLKSQLPRKNTQGLYELTLACLRELPRNPLAIAQSFRLKLLQLEGLLQIQDTCLRCENPSSGLTQGESVCTIHQPHLFFPDKEWGLLLRLGLAKRFSELEAIDFSAEFIAKSDWLISERLQ